MKKDDFEWLNKTYLKDDIDDVLDQMENFAGLKKYKSAKLTANNWLKRRQDSNNKPDYKKAQDKQIADMMRKIGR